MTTKSVLGRKLIWKYLWEPLLGPLSSPVRGHIAKQEVDQSFAHIHQFVAECNDSIARYVPPGLLNSTGVSLAAWSREGEEIISTLSLRSLKKREMTIPIRIAVGTGQVKIGDESMSLSDSEKLLNSISRKVSQFFSM